MISDLQVDNDTDQIEDDYKCNIGCEAERVQVS